MKAWTLTTLAVAAGLAAAGCAVAPEPGAGPVPAEAGAEPQPARDDVAAWDDVPPGYGTLRQDDVTVSLRSGALLVKLTPLRQGVIALAAPDTYDRLRSVRERAGGEVERRMGAEAELFLVSFFSYEPNQAFRPTDLTLSYQGRVLRPAAVVAITPGWGAERLQQQETQMAVYAFEGPLDLRQPLRVRYDMEESDGWSRIVPRLDVERSRVQARAGG
jgi:hypothetical protein